MTSIQRECVANYFARPRDPAQTFACFTAHGDVRATHAMYSRLLLDDAPPRFAAATLMAL